MKTHLWSVSNCVFHNFRTVRVCWCVLNRFLLFLFMMTMMKKNLKSTCTATCCCWLEAETVINFRATNDKFDVFQSCSHVFCNSHATSISILMWLFLPNFCFTMKCETCGRKLKSWKEKKSRYCNKSLDCTMCFTLEGLMACRLPPLRMCKPCVIQWTEGRGGKSATEIREDKKTIAIEWMYGRPHPVFYCQHRRAGCRAFTRVHETEWKLLEELWMNTRRIHSETLLVCVDHL